MEEEEARLLGDLPASTVKKESFPRELGPKTCSTENLHVRLTLIKPSAAALTCAHAAPEPPPHQTHRSSRVGGRPRLGSRSTASANEALVF